MTNFADRVILQSKETAPVMSGKLVISKLWGFLDGKWNAQDFVTHGNSFLTFTNLQGGSTSGTHINLFESVYLAFRPSLNETISHLVECI